MKAELLSKLNDRSATICVVGLGYVGLPLIKRLNEVGFPTLGLDIDQSKIDALESGQAYIKHIEVDEIKEAISVGKCKVTTDFSNASDADVIVLCVPTPLNKYREPDLSFVTGSVETLMPFLRPGQMLSLESTTYPGTTDEEIVPRVEQQGLTVGDDFFVVYSPEREDPGNPDFGTHSIPKVFGGVTSSCSEVAALFYSQIIDQVIPVSSTKVAEMTKIVENTYRAVNIGLVNELKVVADKMGIDIFEVIDAAKTKPFGFTPFYPGPGLGGHCIPIDPFYLTWKSREFGLNTRFIETAGDINSAMPHYVCEKVSFALNKFGLALNGSSVLVLGVSYKKNVDDCRESPSINIIEELIQSGCGVSYCDPHVEKVILGSCNDLCLTSLELEQLCYSEYDAVVIATDHDDYDYEKVREESKVIIDARGVFQICHSKIVRA